MPLDEPKTRKRIITIRHATPSRRGIVLIVAQLQNPMGKWLVPTITFDGPMMPILESGRYARDVGIGLLVAAFFYNEMMTAVENSEQEEQSMDLSIDDEN